MTPEQQFALSELEQNVLDDIYKRFMEYRNKYVRIEAAGNADEALCVNCCSTCKRAYDVAVEDEEYCSKCLRRLDDDKVDYCNFVQKIFFFLILCICLGVIYLACGKDARGKCVPKHICRIVREGMNFTRCCNETA